MTNEEEIITFRYKFDIPITSMTKRHIFTNEEVKIVLKAMQNNILWCYPNATPRRIRLKHSLILFYYKHFRCFRIWYHNRLIQQ